MDSLPRKQQGRPLLVGVELDKAIQDYIKSLRLAGGVVNTAITLAAAEPRLDILVSFIVRVVTLLLGRTGQSRR